MWGMDKSLAMGFCLCSLFTGILPDERKLKCSLDQKLRLMENGQNG
jgi:hypothetical protein